MIRAVFIGTFDPFHGGHIGQLLRAHARIKFDEVLILINKNPRHKPDASNWQARLKMAELTMDASNAPFKYKIGLAEDSAANEISVEINYKITGIDSFCDDISDSSRWKSVTRRPMIILSIPGIDDSVLYDTLNNAPSELINKINYTYVSEQEIPIMNFDFLGNKLSSQRVHSTYLRSGADSTFIPKSVQDYIHSNNLYS